jgi:hypothetical protein
VAFGADPDETLADLIDEVDNRNLDRALLSQGMPSSVFVFDLRNYGVDFAPPPPPPSPKPPPPRPPPLPPPQSPYPPYTPIPPPPPLPRSPPPVISGYDRVVRRLPLRAPSSFVARLSHAHSHAGQRALLGITEIIEP